MDCVRGSSVEGDELDPVRIERKEKQRVHRTLNPNRVIEKKEKKRRDSNSIRITLKNPNPKEIRRSGGKSYQGFPAAVTTALTRDGTPAAGLLTRGKRIKRTEKIRMV